jgi:hypothetical protein
MATLHERSTVLQYVTHAKVAVGVGKGCGEDKLARVLEQ